MPGNLFRTSGIRSSLRLGDNFGQFDPQDVGDTQEGVEGWVPHFPLDVADHLLRQPTWEQTARRNFSLNILNP
jgi:hypothetical protein